MRNPPAWYTPSRPGVEFLNEADEFVRVRRACMHAACCRLVLVHAYTCRYAAGVPSSPIGTSLATFPARATWELGVSSRASRARHSSRSIGRPRGRRWSNLILDRRIFGGNVYTTTRTPRSIPRSVVIFRLSFRIIFRLIRWRVQRFGVGRITYRL